MSAEETGATPLHLVFEEDLGAWRDQQSAAAQAWIRMQGWNAEKNRVPARTSLVQFAGAGIIEVSVLPTTDPF